MFLPPFKPEELSRDNDQVSLKGHKLGVWHIYPAVIYFTSHNGP